MSDPQQQVLNFTAQKPILDEILAQAGFRADPTQALLAASIGNSAARTPDEDDPD